MELSWWKVETTVRCPDEKRVRTKKIKKFKCSSLSFFDVTRLIILKRKDSLRCFEVARVLAQVTHPNYVANV